MGLPVKFAFLPNVLVGLLWLLRRHLAEESAAELELKFGDSS